MSKKTTKRALAMSFVSVFLCVCMLVGTTFAWFTDSVTSSNNIIKSGTLDVTMEWADGTKDPASVTWTDASTGAIFNYDKWEPGYVEVRHIKIENKGTLALKYQLNIIANGEVSDLADVIDVYYADPAEQVATRDALDGKTPMGTLTEALAGMATTASGELAAGTSDTITIALKMQESATNEYQNLSIGSNFAVQLLAAQLAYESDSFNNQYDIAAAPATSAPVTLPTTAADTTVETSVAKVEVPAAVVANLVGNNVTSIALTHSELKVDTANNTLTFDSVELVNQNGDVIDLDSNTAGNLTVTLPATGIADGNSVMVYHDGAYVTTAVVTGGKISYEVAHLCEVQLVPVAKYFSVGKGTEADPFIIKDADDLSAISDMCDAYSYFKVADGVTTLDMTGVGKIKLNGSFDGNGVVLNNLTTALFQTVGKVGEAQEIKISNLTANVHTTDGSALVRNIYNPGETIFENVTMHGYIEGQYNMGSFYNYGTANSGSGDGANYTVSFVNATSDVTLVCTTGNAIGGMLGHGFEGANYKLSINMDTNSGYTGAMYTTGTATCYKVMAMCSHATYVLNGVETSRYENTCPSTKLTVAAPTVADDGYYVTPVEGVDHYVVYLNSQLTAYDANGNKIDNKAGMTWNLGKETIASGFNGKVFDLIKSANIVNDTANDLGYAMNNGTLTIYSGRSDNYASGWVTLQVNQYRADGALLATGILTVYTFAES